MKYSTWAASLTEKTTPADGDLVVVLDSAASNEPKKMQKSNLVGAGTGSGIDPSGWADADAMTYAAADDPSFTVTVTGDQSAKYSAGMRVRLTQATGGVKYFIITRVAVSTDTTLTLYGGTDYDLANEAITSPSYSVVKAPAGFPLDITKWTVTVTDTSDRSQASPSSGTWYNLGSLAISLPVGSWRLEYSATCDAEGGTGVSFYATLSTGNNSESNNAMTFFRWFSTRFIETGQRSGIATVAAKTAYYLNAKVSGSSIVLHFRGDLTPTVMRAVCAYL